jgi:hypothetical protein
VASALLPYGGLASAAIAASHYIAGKGAAGAGSKAGSIYADAMMSGATADDAEEVAAAAFSKVARVAKIVSWLATLGKIEMVRELEEAIREYVTCLKKCPNHP